MVNVQGRPGHGGGACLRRTSPARPRRAAGPQGGAKGPFVFREFDAHTIFNFQAGLCLKKKVFFAPMIHVCQTTSNCFDVACDFEQNWATALCYFVCLRHACTHACTHVPKHTRAHTRAHGARTHALTHTETHIMTHTHARMNAREHACIRYYAPL